MLCRNCKYFTQNMSWQAPDNIYYYGLCTHPKAIKTISYHTGKIDYKYARDMRQDMYSCSKSARYYLDVNDIEPPKTVSIVSCTDCVHQTRNTSWYDKSNQSEYAFCTHPLVTKFDMISGEPVYPYTSDMRNNAKPNDIKSCGTSGFMFDEKITAKQNDDSKTSEESVREKAVQVLFLLLLIILILL